MKTIWAFIFLSLFALPAIAQQPPGPSQVTQLQLLLNTSTPPVQSASVAIVGGTPGNQTIYYWIVANYAVGSSSPAGPFIALRAPNILNGSNYVAISPTYPLGAVSVDLLKTSTAVSPNGSCNCAVATSQTTATITDQSNSTSSYTVTPFSPSQFTLSLDNEVISAGVTHLILRQAGTFVADLSIGGGGGGGTPCTVTPNSIQYNAGGTFGCATQFTYAAGLLQVASGGTLQFLSGSTFDLTSISTSGTFKLPNGAGCTASTSRYFCFDTTAGIMHQLTAGNDSLSMAILSTDTNANHAVFQTTTAGISTSRSIGIADLPGSGVANQLFISAGSGAAFKSLADLNNTEYIAGGGTAQAQTVNLAPAATALGSGLLVRWLPAAANTAAAPTLTVNSLASKPITKCGTTALVANDLVPTAIAEAIYDGTEFQLINPQQTGCGAGGGGGGTVTSVGFTVNAASSSGIFTVTGVPITGSGTANLSLAGTSGGHPFFSAASVLSSTGAGNTHGLWLAQGAGNADTTTPAGTLNQLLASGGGSADPGYKSLADLNNTEYIAGGGTAQAQTVTLAPGATSLVAGLTVRWKPVAANTAAAPTLAVNGLTATAITKCGTTALVANDLVTTAIATATYDGTEFQLLNPQQTGCGAGGGGGTPASPPDSIQYNGGGTFAALASPTTNGVYNVVYSVTSGAAVPPTTALPGVVPNIQTGTTYTIGSGSAPYDRFQFLSFNNAASIAVTANSAATYGSFMGWLSCAGAAGTATITPTTSTVTWYDGVGVHNAQSNLALQTGDCAWWFSDSGAANAYYAVVLDGNASSLNGTAFAGTQNDVVAFGSGNTPFDTNILYTNLVTASAAAGATNMLALSAGANKALAYKSFADSTPFDYAAGGGTAQAQTVTLSPAATSLTAGLEVHWKPTAANTAAAPTLAVNGLTATSITKCGTTALVANDLTTTSVAIAVYDGTEFQLINPQAAGCGGGGGAVSSVSGDGNVITNSGSTGAVTLTLGTHWQLGTNTQALILNGGADASANSALGGITVRGANQTGAGGSTSQGGFGLFAGGTNAATNAASAGGSVELLAGSSIGATTPGLQGLMLITHSYAQSGTVTQWNLVCFTGTAGAVTNCSGAPQTVAGVAINLNGGTTSVLVAEPGSEVPINASAAVTGGDMVYAGGTAGKVTDCGATSGCPSGVLIGRVIAVTGAWPAYPDGTTFPTLSTTLPLVKLENLNPVSNVNNSNAQVNVTAATGFGVNLGVGNGVLQVNATNGTSFEASMNATGWTSGSSFASYITSPLKATAALTAGQVVKSDTTNAESVVVATTADTGAGAVLTFVTNAPGAAANAHLAMPGTLIYTPKLGTGTCTLGQFVINDTTTNGDVKCTSTFTAGTVLGRVIVAQSTVGSAVGVLVWPQ